MASPRNAQHVYRCTRAPCWSSVGNLAGSDSLFWGKHNCCSFEWLSNRVYSAEGYSRNGMPYKQQSIKCDWSYIWSIERWVRAKYALPFRRRFWTLDCRNSNLSGSRKTRHHPNVLLSVRKTYYSSFDPSLTPKAGEANESYTLSIPANSAVATITAESSYGVLFALQTFNQLFYTHTYGQIYTSHAPVLIKDEPKFQHRGLNMDLSRHFYPKEVILRVIDVLSWQKFNRFHMHITDSQSWSPPSPPSL